VDILRTPEERFYDLPGYDFPANYAEVIGDKRDSIRVHYVDEGPKDAKPVLLMHGEPSWSYLYRNIISKLSSLRHRVIAPDLVGFGKSDKLAARQDYTYKRHVDWMKSLLFDSLDLKNITLFCQDWGGLIGLRLIAIDPDRFDRVIAANTGLPIGDETVTDAFFAWQKFSQEVPELPVGQIVKMGCVNPLSREVIRAYDAPFPNESYKVGARMFPLLVPTSPSDPAAADQKAAWSVLEEFSKPFLTAFSDSDPITKGGERVFQERVKGAEGIKHLTVKGAGHFLQEDKPDEVADIIDGFISGRI
jgi:haloalkane dehalogenase